MAKYILLDSGYWHALYEPRDEHHQAAVRLFPRLIHQVLLVPWPTLYEVINTRFVKRSPSLARFGALLRLPGVRRVADEPYRDAALAVSIQSPAHRRLSLVDIVMRAMIEDDHVRVDALITFNPRDFFDVCATHRVELVPLS